MFRHDGVPRHTGRRWLVVAMIIASALSLSVRAQEAKPARSTEKDAAIETSREPARGMFGDTKRFSRMGGWGSIGGAIGQFGMARTALITMPPVQQELKLTDDQKEAVREWLDGTRKRGEEMGRAMRERQQQEGGGDPFRQPDAPLAARVFQFTSMMNQVSEFLREGENGLARILTAPQRKRLDQIALQMEGIGALVRPEVAEILNMDEDQVLMIQEILARSRLMQLTSWIEQGTRMAAAGRRESRPESRPDGPNGPPRGPEAERSPNADAQRDPAAGAPEPGRTRELDPRQRERAEAMRKQFESLRDRNDAIQERTTREVLRVLTKGQRAKFDRMLGPPFDPSKLDNNLGRPGQPPRGAATNQTRPDSGTSRSDR